MKIAARKNFILFEKVEPEIDGMKSKLLLSPEDLNPGLVYGKVISVGSDIEDIEIDDHIYGVRNSATEINIFTEKIYALKDEFIVAVIKNN